LALPCPLLSSFRPHLRRCDCSRRAIPEISADRLTFGLVPLISPGPRPCANISFRRCSHDTAGHNLPDPFRISLPHHGIPPSHALLKLILSPRRRQTAFPPRCPLCYACTAMSPGMHPSSPRLGHNPSTQIGPGPSNRQPSSSRPSAKHPSDR
jgi:hypothetical protein